ncbi:mechanosensitive ion channel [Verrucomicrobiaceae bacterium 5K15]|uniref:Mechanosensitive ion channel n=1 Tax=Oceaniferula flava TaxID=2800421 RepID=A0AAE2SFM8_9BACT|nr:mechanosensitive ion channel family protein [Oceaniferula flavus]MBK1855471.1 mechanosensitive ion channel [Oceaniferula flavus]MBM1136777.1 mechanosensitive ion channel [Oceaniferula flavus]
MTPWHRPLRLLLLTAACLIAAFSGQLHAQEGGITEEKVEVTPVTADQNISKRLLNIYQAIGGLENIEVSTISGVVILEGTVIEGESAETAVALAEKTEGVIFVRNQIETSTEISGRLSPLRQKALVLWQTFVKKLPLIGLSALIVAVAIFLGRWLTSREKIYTKLGLHGMPAMLVKRLMRLLILLLAIALAMELLDATTMVTAVLGLAGVAGIAIGFAMQGIVENYIAGMLLSVRNPFELGDAVEVGSRKGTVVRLTSRDTVLMTVDGNHLRVPNGKILKEEIVNFSRNPKRRFDFAVGVSVELDLVRVKQLGISILQKIDGVLDDPKPSVIIEELGDSSVKMRFFGWLDQRQSDYLKVRSESIRLIKTKFDQEGIEMPEPIYRVINQPPASGENRSTASSQGEPSFEDTDTGKDLDLEEAVRDEIASNEETNLLSKDSTQL